MESLFYDTIVETEDFGLEKSICDDQTSDEHFKNRQCNPDICVFYESIRRNRDDLRKFEHYQQSISKFRECRQKYFPLWGLASSGGSKGSKTSKRDKKQLGVWMDGY